MAKKKTDGYTEVHFPKATTFEGNYYAAGTYEIKDELVEPLYAEGQIIQPPAEEPKPVARFSNLPKPRTFASAGKSDMELYQEKKQTAQEQAAARGGKAKLTGPKGAAPTQEQLDALSGDLPDTFPHKLRLNALGVNRQEDAVDQLGKLSTFDFTEDDVAEVRAGLAALVAQGQKA